MLQIEEIHSASGDIFQGVLLSTCFPLALIWILLALTILTGIICNMSILLLQHSKFRSKAVSKIIDEAEAKKNLFASAVQQQSFCQCNQKISVFCVEDIRLGEGEGG